MNKKPGSHLYNRGWFGLIPLIGAFAGAWLLLLGVFKYKNTKLSLIGLGGILLTVLIYGSMFYYSFHSEAGRAQFIPVAQSSLNSLVKDIEFHKLKHGVYPDSLEEMDNLSMSSYLGDPISARYGTKYYYERLDSGYTLFSKGLDRIPKTKDDVYPSLSLEKTGFLVPYK